jgi:hypothetical protein
MSQNHNVEIRITAQNLSTPEFQKVVQELRGLGTAADVAAEDVQKVGRAAKQTGADLGNAAAAYRGIASDLQEAANKADAAKRAFNEASRSIGGDQSLARSIFPDLAANADAAEAELRQLQAAARDATGDFDSMGKSALSLNLNLKNIVETAAGVALGDLIADAPRQLIAFGKASIDAASDFQESMNKVEVVFGDASDSMMDWSENAAEAFGLSQSAALDAAGTFGNLFTSMGIAQGAAAEMSQGIVQLAADLGSFNNIGTDVALEKLRAGLVGEIEPLRSLGVNINAVMVQQKAMDMGLAENVKSLTAADKAQASYALILEQTTNAQGDFVRTADGLANSTKTLQANFQDLQVQVGQVVVPIATDFVGALNDAAEGAMFLTGMLGELSTALTGNADAFDIAKQKAREWSDEVRDAGYAAAEFGVGIATGVVDWLWGFGDAADDASESGSELASMFGEELIVQIREAAQASAEFNPLFNETIALLSRVSNDAEAGGASLDKFGGAFGRQAEMAGLANERNTEFFHTLELGSGKAAEMAFHVAKVAEAQQLLADAYQDGLRGMELFNQQSSEYAGIQSTLEKGYEIVLKKQEEGVKLTDEEQQLLDRYPELYGRLEGAQEDATTQAALFAGANAEVMIAQDELNAAIARGEGNLDPYIQRLNDAKALVGDQAYADPMIGSINTLTDTVTTKLVPAIEDMTRKIEYISKPWLIEIDAATEAAEAELLRILDLINRINSSSAAPYMPGMGDPGGGQRFAEGGLVSEPTLAMIGEAGPELVLPLTRPDRMRELLALAGFPMMADGGGAGFRNTGGAGGMGSRPILDIAVSFEPIEWDFLFEGLDKAAEDWGAQAGQKFIGFFRGNIEDLASGEMLADARAELEDLFTIRGIAVESGAGAEIIAEIDAAIRAQSDEVNAIGASMGTSIVEGIAASLASGEAAALLAEFRQNVFDALDLGDIADEQVDLQSAIDELTALRDAAAELGDTATADVLTAQLSELEAELALVAQIAGTDAVAAWQANQEAMEAAAEVAERMAEKQAMLHESMLTAIEGIAAGGDATGSFFERLLEQYEEAKEAFDLGLLLGVPPEVLEQLGNDLTEVESTLLQTTNGLKQALAAGLIDEETLQALAESGGEAFEQLYDSIFGPGALDAIAAGWNDISDASLAQLQELMSQMEDGGASLVDTLVGQIAAGAISYEEALALYGDATGEEVNAILEELERMQTALLVDLAEALATGSDPTAIEENLAVIEMLMDSLADKAVETAETVVKAGKSMGVYGDDLKGALEDISETTNPGGTGTGSGTRRSGGFLDGMNNPGFDSLDRNGDGIISQRELDLAGVPSGFRWGLPDVPTPVVTTEAPAPLPRSADRSRETSEMRDAIRQGAREGIASGMTGFQIPPGR